MHTTKQSFGNELGPQSLTLDGTLDTFLEDIKKNQFNS